MLSPLTLTESAIGVTNAFIAKNEEYRGKYLRIYLSGKGCDGFEYGVTFDNKEDADKVISIPGTIDLICDERTFEFVEGSEIDWVDDERGQGYLVNNPHHNKFRGKFYKREVWKSRLSGPKNQ